MISASKLEITRHCPGWLALPHVEEKHEGQAEGNERHSGFDARIKAGDIPDALAARWPGATWRSELRMAWNWTNDTARELPGVGHRDYAAADPLTEICMTIDAVGSLPGLVIVGDFKSFDPNVPRARVNGQVHLGALAVCRALRIDNAEVFIHHEARPFDVAAISWVDLETFSTEAADIVRAAFGTRKAHREGHPLKLATGYWCRYCPAFASCPKQADLKALVVSNAIETQVEATLPLDDSNAAEMYDLWKRIDMLSKRIRSTLYARAAEKPFVLSNGNTFGPVTKEGNRQIDGDKAYALIRDDFGQEKADAAVSREATQASIKAALGPAGLKTTMKRLEEAGGITRKTSTVIEEIPAVRALAEAG